MPVTVTFQDNEALFLIDLLGRVVAEWECQSSHDYPVPNTEANVALLERIRKWRGHPPLPFVPCSGGAVYLHRLSLLEYLAAKVEQAREDAIRRTVSDPDVKR
jgi:hypothetical protein